jgi:hypothetical protein
VKQQFQLKAIQRLGEDVQRGKQAASWKWIVL